MDPSLPVTVTVTVSVPASASASSSASASASASGPIPVVPVVPLPVPQAVPAVKRPTGMNSLLAGAMAGAICSITCSPLDVTKVRIQIQGSLGINKYHGSVYSIMKLIHAEEGLRGFFKGLGPALFTVPLFWGIYWGSYDYLKYRLECHMPDSNIHMRHTLAAMGAGMTGDIITNPLWVIRTRIQALELHKSFKSPSSSSVGANRPAVSTDVLTLVRSMYQQEGMSSFYKGLGASFLGLIHVAIQFPLYEYLKSVARTYRKGEETSVDIMISSICSKLVASSISYPHEVLRARLQDQRSAEATGHKPLGLIAMTKKLVRDEGTLALWSGLRLNVLRMVPATLSTFLSYEYMSRWLSERKSNQTHN